VTGEKEWSKAAKREKKKNKKEKIISRTRSGAMMLQKHRPVFISPNPRQGSVRRVGESLLGGKKRGREKERKAKKKKSLHLIPAFLFFLLSFCLFPAPSHFATDYALFFFPFLPFFLLCRPQRDERSCTGSIPS
jgi:hypothetical protein